MERLKLQRLAIKWCIIAEIFFSIHDVIEFRGDIIDLLISIAFNALMIVIYKAILKISIRPKIDEIQEKFYKSLPRNENEYIKVKLSFFEKDNERYFNELHSSFNFYAQQRPNDMIVLLAVDAENFSLVHKTKINRKDIEIEEIFPEEKANFKDDNFGF